MDTKVVRIRRSGGRVVQGCDVYIGRACTMGGWDLPDSKWANPYPVTKYGRDEALSRYRTYICAKIANNPAIYDLDELRGKTLGCWCAPDPCHGDILRDLLGTQ